MADVITRLKVESTEYDSKIKRASQGLLHMEQACRKVGGTLAILEKDELEFVKGLGKMETVSKDARGQLNELTKAFTDLSLQYKRLTDEEKQGDFGKALASSLGELKSRIQDTKGQLNEINGEINGGGGLTGALDQLAGKFGLNIQQLAGWGAAIGAAKVGLDVAKDAFFASEATVDEWGRIMDSNKSLYEGFLTALNTGDISGYLSRIDEIVSAARTAYNEIDRLGTMQTIQAPQKSAQQTENDRIRQMIQTGHYIAPLDSRKPAPGMKDGQLLTPEQIRRLEQQLQNGMKTFVGLIGNEVKQTGKAIDAVYKRQAKELGMSLSEFRKGTSSMAEFDKRVEGAKKYQEYITQNTTRTFDDATRTWDSVYTGGKNPYENFKGWDVFRVDGDRYNELVQLILQRDQQAAQAYGMQSQAYRAINRAEGITTRTLLGGGSGGSKTGGGGSATTVEKELNPMQQAQKQISALTEEALTADEGRLEVIRQEIAALQHQVDVYKQIQEYAQGGREKWNIQVGDRKAFESEQRKRFDENTVTPSRLQVMEASVMKEMRVEDAKVDTETLHSLIKDALQNGIDTTSLDLTPIAEQIGEGVNVPDEKWQEILDKYNELREQIGEEPIKIDFKSGKIEDVANVSKEIGKNMKFAASMTQTLGSAISSIEDPGAKVAATVAQSIATIAMAYSDALAKDSSSKFNIFSFIAAAAAATVSMATTIASIHSATGYASGGIVKGNSYSGDRIGGLVDGNQLVGLNAGEVVLTRAMTGNLASQLSSQNSGGSVSSTPYVTGEKIILGINNYAKKQGWGELVFSRR